MTIPDYTIIVGVDKKHLEQLKIVWPTWIKHKRDSILNHRLLIFYDQTQLAPHDIHDAKIDHPDLVLQPWPPVGVDYPQGNDKWTGHQRHKMLAGYIHVSSFLASVNTEYWLKLDTDCVATSNPDWIDLNWFRDEPAIIAHPWGFTKPANQMMLLDDWANANLDHLDYMYRHPPLNLKPINGDDRVRHPRIEGFCCFFKNHFTRNCARWATDTCGRYQMPVPSVDGYYWYCAARQMLPIVKVNMKRLGWEVWSTMDNIKRASEEAMCNG